MNNVEIIDRSETVQCYHCKEKPNEKCPSCKGTGKWHRESYVMVATQENGQKIAFDVDQLGK